MRFIKKYKNLYNHNLFLKYFSKKRILKFNRPKWLKLKLFLKRKKRKFLYNLTIIRSPYKYWDRIKRKYKEGLILKRVISNYYDNYLSRKSFKNLLHLKINLLNTLILIFIKSLFRLEILLWKLNFFNSIYEAKQAIKNKKILINSKFSSIKKFLKKGDIIVIKNLKKNLITSNFFLFFSFIEVDYYTNTILILKDPNEALKKDFYLLLVNYVSYKTFIDFLQK